MSVAVTINNKTFNIPVPGEDPGWGEDTTGWIEEANKVIASLFGPGDILEASASIANDQTTVQTVIGLAFDPGTVRSAVIEYSIYRTSTSTTSGKAETGKMEIVYDNNASAGNKWLLSQETTGDSGVVLDITDAGQLEYTSSDIGATGYTGTIKFIAKALSQ